MPKISYNTGAKVPNFGTKISTIPIITNGGKKIRRSSPIQWVGFIPLVCCSPSSADGVFSMCDCRSYSDDDCYINPVFASSSDADVLKNDKSSFLLEYPFFYEYQRNSDNASFKIQKWNGSSWATLSTLTNNNYGTYYDFGSLCIKELKGYLIEWRKVLIAHGEGLYRFRADSIIYSTSSCVVSEPFCLRSWSCDGVDKTVRWEAYIEGGRIGSISDPKKYFSFCCLKDSSNGVPAEITPVKWYDSVRMYGFFGREKSNYERVNYKYDNGEVIQHKNELINSYEFQSAMLPKYLHDRLKSYGNMADRLYVSDFNSSNSDYELDQKLVVCDGGYEPEYPRVKGENASRLSHVSVVYKQGIQNVVRDKCCGQLNIRVGAK